LDKRRVEWEVGGGAPENTREASEEKKRSEKKPKTKRLGELGNGEVHHS